MTHIIGALIVAVQRNEQDLAFPGIAPIAASLNPLCVMSARPRSDQECTAALDGKRVGPNSLLEVPGFVKLVPPGPLTRHRGALRDRPAARRDPLGRGARPRPALQRR